MLRNRLLAAGLFLCLMILTGGQAAAQQSVAVLVDDRPVAFDVPPVIRSARTFLPIRRVTETLGATVGWEAAEQKVVVQWRDRLVELWVDRPDARINGRPATLDVAPFIVDGRTMVPLRFLAETFQFIVDWDSVTLTVLLTSPQAIPPAQVALTASAQTVRVGETVTIAVYVNRARSLYTAAVNLDYAPLLTGVEISPGEVGMDLTAVSRIDHRSGSVEYAASRVGAVRGFTGDGLLYSVRFKAQAPGIAYLFPSLDSVLVDSGLETLNIVRSGVAIQIEN